MPCLSHRTSQELLANRGPALDLPTGKGGNSVAQTSAPILKGTNSSLRLGSTVRAAVFNRRRHARVGVWLE